MNSTLEKKIEGRIKELERPKRKAFSLMFPSLAPISLNTRYCSRKVKNILDKSLSRKKYDSYLKNIIARHQSVLVRRLGDSDLKLQKQKIKNLEVAIKEIDKLVIPPGKTFSFWHLIGNPTKKRGYVDGMLLSDGKIIEGIGGGLCQLSNLLYWLFLHSPLEVIERHHHSHDSFPDSGRVLPFGSGATVMYNFIDLKVKNASDQSLQLKVWMDDKHLKGQILSDRPSDLKYHIFEQNHYFIKRGEKYYRFNEVWREKIKNGKILNKELIMTNFAPVIYQVTDDYLKKNNFKLIDITNK